VVRFKCSTTLNDEELSGQPSTSQTDDHNMRSKRGDYVEKLHTLYLSQIVVHKVVNKFTLLFDSASYNVCMILCMVKFRLD
jgi:hypothetical protein